jgi:hypothetical protein
MFAVLRRGVILCVFILSLCLTPGAAQAQMSQLSEENLKGITGQSGVSINIDGGAQVYYDLIKFSDTEVVPNWIELHNVKVDDGAGGNFYFSTRYDDEPVVLVTNFLTYYGSGPHYDATKAAYTWANNELAILTDTKVQDGTIAGLEDGLKRVLYPITYDVATDDSGRTFVSILDTSHLNPRSYSVGSLVINAYDIKDYSAPLATAVTTYLASNPDPGLSAAYWANPANPSLWDPNDFLILDALNDINIDPLIVKYQASVNHTNTSQPLGSIKLDALRQGPSFYRFWAHSQGISFDYQTVISADALSYTYNTSVTSPSTTGTALSFSRINIAGSATGDPRYPNGGPESSPPYTYQPWSFSGTFNIGTIDGTFSTTPATIDVATDSSNNTSLYMSLPMVGTVRVADVNFGGQGFGPVAIDNIQVHRLNLKISP